MDVQQLIGEVARRHNVLVTPEDPIFVAVTLNELLLAQHVQELQAAVEAATRAAAAASFAEAKAATRLGDQVKQLRSALEHAARTASVVPAQLDAVRRLAAQVSSEGPGVAAAEQVRRAGLVTRREMELVLAEFNASLAAFRAGAARVQRLCWWAAAGALTCAASTILTAAWLVATHR